MTTYYVSTSSGSDSNNGLGPDASHASNKPFATIGKLIAASGVMVSGDTAYIAPGSYRQVVSVGITSPVSETQIIGDPGNAQGFKTSGGVLEAPGDVVWTAYTTNDTTAPSGTSLVTLAGRDFMTFQKIVFISGSNASASIINAGTTNSVNIKLQDCTLIFSSGPAIQYTAVVDTAANWTIDRCIFFGIQNNSAVDISIPTTATAADYDINFVMQNCLFLGGLIGVTIASSGANSNKGGGVDALNCTFYGQQSVAFRTNSAGLSTSIPCTVNNCLILSQGTALSANTSGQITEDYCRIQAGTLRTNVSAGANSITGLTHAALLEIGQSLFMGRTTRPFLQPTSGSPILGFGSTGAPSVDLLNRTRPSGGASLNNAVGAQERHQIAAKETSVTQAGATAWKITGPGDHDIAVPVDATSTSISIYVRYDSTHAATNKPQVILQANGEIGVSTETKTMTAAADTWEQLTFSTFTPTAKGYVTIRLVSRAAAGGGIAYFDTAAGGASSTATFDYFRQGEPLSTIVAGGSGGVKNHPGMQGGANG